LQITIDYGRNTFRKPLRTGDWVQRSPLFPILSLSLSSTPLTPHLFLPHLCHNLHVQLFSSLYAQHNRLQPTTLLGHPPFMFNSLPSSTVPPFPLLYSPPSILPSALPSPLSPPPPSLLLSFTSPSLLHLPSFTSLLPSSTSPFSPPNSPPSPPPHSLPPSLHNTIFLQNLSAISFEGMLMKHDCNYFHLIISTYSDIGHHP